MSGNKYTFYPLRSEVLHKFYKHHESSIWFAEKPQYSLDKPDLEKLNKDEKHYLMRVLAFFAASDGIVNENLAVRFYKDVELPEAKAFYTIQMYQESVHSETYSLLIDTYETDPEEKNKLFNAIETMPIIKKKADWAFKWLDSQESFVKRLIAFAVIEGIFFSGSFCAIFWFRKRGLFLHGLSVANNYIFKDESLHWQFAAALFKVMDLKMTQKEFEEIIKEAVEIEIEFIRDSLPVSLIGMNADQMIKYIKHMADVLAVQFGFDKIYREENPFDFMKLMMADSLTNFFERKVAGQYQKSKEKDVSFDEDF